jgi:hypothetical protein
MQDSAEVPCPWCGEWFTTFVDPSVEQQSYTEDCYVCCRPIVMKVRILEDGDVQVMTERE